MTKNRWPVVSLKELIAETQSGFASGERAPDGVIQLRMNNVTVDGHLEWSSITRVPATKRQIDKYQLFSGDVLFNSTNSPDLVGKSTKFFDIGEPVVFSNHFFRLRVNSTKLDPTYLIHWCVVQWQSRIFEHLSTQWVNQAAVRIEDLLSLQLCLPTLPEQKRIATILEKADRLRRLRRYACELSDTYLQSVFLEMFGHPVQNPMGWDYKVVRDMCHLVRGSSPRPQGDPRYYGGLVPRLMVADITRDGMYVKPTIDSLTQEGATQSRFVKAGTVVMVVSGIVGVPAILIIDACIHDGFVGFRDLTQDCLPEFFAHLLAVLNRVSQSQAVGAIWNNLTTDQINQWKIIFPPLGMQKKFVSIVQKYGRLKSQQQEAERQAEHLFQTLLHRAFKGELN